MPDDGAPASDFSAAAFDRAVIDAVWDGGVTIPGTDPALWRKDRYGAWMHRLDYGRRHCDFGWEIGEEERDRGLTGVEALRPLHWRNYLDSVAAGTRSRVQRRGGGLV
ncbi:MAG: hypothetical protein JNK37_10820 [Verrucomicrobiales bacterium]|nr:hypothetical protein [Verrucomicrobiales bacterium]